MFATGSAGPVGLASTEPPLSPETIGRAPSNFDAPVPLVPLEELVGLKKQSAPAAPAAEQSETAAEQPATDMRRVVLRLVGGDELELGTYDGKDAALERAEELVALVTEAESAGRWPEVDGRLLRPDSIVSVDLLVVEQPPAL